MNGIPNVNHIAVPVGYRIPELHHVFRIRAELDDAVIVDCEITDILGIRERVKYCLRPTDPFGLAPTIRVWRIFNPFMPIDPYVPPTEEEIREQQFWPICNFALRIALIECGYRIATVDKLLQDINDPEDQERKQTEWTYAPRFARVCSFIEFLEHRLNLTRDQMDAVWQVGMKQMQETQHRGKH